MTGKVIIAKNFMVFILAASSLHHALETLPPEKRDQYKEKIFSIPGLSLNPHTVAQKIRKKNCPESAF